MMTGASYLHSRSQPGARSRNEIIEPVMAKNILCGDLLDRNEWN